MKRLIIALPLVLFALTGCATKTAPQKQQIQSFASEPSGDIFDDFENEFDDTSSVVIFDPLSGYNRLMTQFNDKVYIYALEPLAQGYAKILPQGLRVSIKNFTEHLKTPIRLSNNLLQFKFKNAAQETGRFAINTIFGLGGFFDPASTDLGWNKHDEDFGQTLGFYGIGEGFHVVLPFLGPSNVRDMIGLGGDAFLSPLTNLGYHHISYKLSLNTAESIGVKTADVVNDTSLRLGQYESLKKDALDLYPFLRDSYTQYRNQQIKE